MMRWKSGARICHILVVGFVLLAVVQPTDSWAATVAECIATHEDSQVRKKESDLISARKTLLICSDDSCPQVIRNDCLLWYEEVKDLVPSITIAARVGKRDLYEAKVFVDDELKATDLGQPIELNPGRYQIRVEVPIEGVKPLTRQWVLIRGQKSRVLEYEFLDPTAVEKEPTKPAPVAQAASDPEPDVVMLHRPVPLYTYVLAGAAPLVAAGGLPFAISGKKKRNEYRDECAPYCSDAQKKEVDRRLRTADIFFVVGGVVGIAAVVTYLVRPEIPKKKPAAGRSAFHWDLLVGARSGRVTWGGAF